MLTQHFEATLNRGYKLSPLCSIFYHSGHVNWFVGTTTKILLYSKYHKDHTSWIKVVSEEKIFFKFINKLKYAPQSHHSEINKTKYFIGDSNRRATMKDLKSLKYLECVIKVTIVT